MASIPIPAISQPSKITSQFSWNFFMIFANILHWYYEFFRHLKVKLFIVQFNKVSYFTRTPKGGSFWPYNFFNVKLLSFCIFLCPLLLNSWVFSFLPPISAFLMSRITLFWILGGLVTWQIGDFWLFSKNEKKIGKNWKIDFFWKFLFWSVANHPSCTLSEFWGENSKVFIFFKK